MSWYFSLPVTYPAGFDQFGNGAIPTSEMTAVQGGSHLHKTAARAWNALAAEARTQGMYLTYTGTYRSFEQQESLFFSRYTTSPVSSSAKTYQGRTYFLIPGNAMAATPGASNHGWGLAIDTAYDTQWPPSPSRARYIAGSPAWPWFFGEGVRKYGFSFEVSSEPWHIRYVAGDRLPAAVLDQERGGATTKAETSVFDPARGEFGDWPAKDGKKLQPADTSGDAIRYAQGVMRFRAPNFCTWFATAAAKASDLLIADGKPNRAKVAREVADRLRGAEQRCRKLAVDGEFGPKSQAAVSAVKEAFDKRKFRGGKLRFPDAAPAIGDEMWRFLDGIADGRW